MEALAKTNKFEAYETALIRGDLKDLTTEERLAYYKQVCDSLGLNPLTKPFEFIFLNGKLTLYARKDATDQLRRVNGVSVDSVQHDFRQELQLYIVTAMGHDKHGRHDASTGAVPISQGLKGEALANQIMKAETKAKRRLTLSLCGLGMLDETEIETIPNALPLQACGLCGDESVVPPATLCKQCIADGGRKAAVPQLTDGAAEAPTTEPESAGTVSASGGGQERDGHPTAPTLSELRSKVIKQSTNRGKVFWELEGKVLLWSALKPDEEVPTITGRTIECTATAEGVKRGFQSFRLEELIHVSEPDPLEIQEQDLVPALEASVKQAAEKKKMPATSEDIPF